MTTLHEKTFRVVRNDGPDAEVNAETVFEYRQRGDLVEAAYSGGKVRAGRLVGVLEGDVLRQAYVQVNQAGEIRSGRSTIAVRRSGGRIQLVDEWRWDAGGSGTCILEETDGGGERA
jgi:hypothetical protein